MYSLKETITLTFIITAKAQNERKNHCRGSAAARAGVCCRREAQENQHKETSGDTGRRTQSFQIKEILKPSFKDLVVLSCKSNTKFNIRLNHN